jgi:small subunit ribosomal protein S17
MEEKSKKTTKRREIDGVVVGNKMDKTVKVRVDTLETHPVYKKVVDRKKIFFAHTDEDLEVGEKVTIRESKPYSKKVRWLVVNNKKE